MYISFNYNMHGFAAVSVRIRNSIFRFVFVRVMMMYLVENIMDYLRGESN